VTHTVELLWFADCANHPAARRMLEEVIAEVAPGTPIHDVDATDPAIAERIHFPGSPTIRVDGRDVDPSYVDPSDYTPRCRLYRTDSGLRGLPERGWIEDALRGGSPEFGWRRRAPSADGRIIRSRRHRPHGGRNGGTDGSVLPGGRSRCRGRKRSGPSRGWCPCHRERGCNGVQGVASTEGAIDLTGAGVGRVTPLQGND